MVGFWFSCACGVTLLCTMSYTRKHILLVGISTIDTIVWSASRCERPCSPESLLHIQSATFKNAARNARSTPIDFTIAFYWGLWQVVYLSKRSAVPCLEPCTPNLSKTCPQQTKLRDFASGQRVRIDKLKHFQSVMSARVFHFP